MTTAPVIGARAPVELVTAPEDTPIAEVGRLMVDTAVRHVLVGPAQRPTAIISMRDVPAVLLGPGAPPVSP
jgi:CBS domain-containing protein